LDLKRRRGVVSRRKRPGCQRTYVPTLDGGYWGHPDVTRRGLRKDPSHDVLLAGSVSTFSIVAFQESAGHAHGLRARPKYAVLRCCTDNRCSSTRGVRTRKREEPSQSHGKRTYSVIMDVLKNQLGYHVFDEIIDAKALFPHRERILCVFETLLVFLGMPFESLRGCYQPRERATSENRSRSPEIPIQLRQASVSKTYTLSDHLWDTSSVSKEARE